MRIASRLLAIRTAEQALPLTDVSSVVCGERWAGVYAVAGKPLWKYPFGEFVLRRAATAGVNIEMTLNKEALKLDC